MRLAVLLQRSATAQRSLPVPGVLRLQVLPWFLPLPLPGVGGGSALVLA